MKSLRQIRAARIVPMCYVVKSITNLPCYDFIAWSRILMKPDASINCSTYWGKKPQRSIDAAKSAKSRKIPIKFEVIIKLKVIPRSSILVPIESAYATSYWSLIHCVSEKNKQKT